MKIIMKEEYDKRYATGILHGIIVLLFMIFIGLLIFGSMIHVNTPPEITSICAGVMLG